MRLRKLETSIYGPTVYLHVSLDLFLASLIFDISYQQCLGVMWIMVSDIKVLSQIAKGNFILNDVQLFLCKVAVSLLIL